MVIKMVFDDDKFYSFNPNIKVVIAHNIKKYRKEKELTQEKLAMYAEISYDFMRRIESGKGEIGFSIQTLYKIATVLDISIDDLIREKEEIKN